MCWHSFIKQSHITTTPSRTSSFAAILKSTASFTFVELCKQYRSNVEFNFIDSTVLINLEDPCKRAFTQQALLHHFPLTYASRSLSVVRPLLMSVTQNWCTCKQATFTSRKCHRSVVVLITGTVCCCLWSISQRMLSSTSKSTCHVRLQSPSRCHALREGFSTPLSAGLPCYVTNELRRYCVWQIQTAQLTNPMTHRTKKQMAILNACMYTVAPDASLLAVG